MSSCHLLLGRPLDLFPLLGCHSVHRFVHLLSFYSLLLQRKLLLVKLFSLTSMHKCQPSWLVPIATHGPVQFYHTAVIFKQYGHCSLLFSCGWLVTLGIDIQVNHWVITLITPAGIQSSVLTDQLTCGGVRLGAVMLVVLSEREIPAVLCLWAQVNKINLECPECLLVLQEKCADHTSSLSSFSIFKKKVLLQMCLKCQNLIILRTDSSF